MVYAMQGHKQQGRLFRLSCHPVIGRNPTLPSIAPPGSRILDAEAGTQSSFDPVEKSELSTAPRTETFNTTTLGNYEFRADTPSHETLYGLLPLKFNGGYLARDILPFPSTGR